jgi:chromosome segregation ATPase
MHEQRDDHAEDGAGTGSPVTTDAAVHLPSAGAPGDLTVLERLEAFRDLIRHGNNLLGEVVSYCRDAEAAVAQFAAEKQDLDRTRTELHEAQQRAEAEAAAAQKALGQVDAQRRELGEMRTELLKAREEVARFQKEQASNADQLEHSLRHAKQQQAQLEEEMQRIRLQATASRAIDSRLGQLDQMEAKLRVTERELQETRRALEDERSRRDRAIALIRPKQVAG